MTRETIINRTITHVEATTGVSIEQIRSKDRHLQTVQARNILSYELFRQHFMNIEIAKVIHRDRSTIYNCIRMYLNDYETNQGFRELAELAKIDN